LIITNLIIYTKLVNNSPKAYSHNICFDYKTIGIADTKYRIKLV